MRFNYQKQQKDIVRQKRHYLEKRREEKIVNILTVLQIVTGTISLVTFAFIFTLIFNKKIEDARKLLIPFGLIFGLFGAITGFTMGMHK